MQPIFQPIEQNQFAKMLSPTLDKFIEMPEDKLYAATVTDKNTAQKPIEPTQNTPNSKLFTLQRSNSDQSTDIQLPEILDISKTQQTRLRQATLKHTIESTIQQLLYAYKTGNQNLSPENQERLKSEIFQRFAFIYSEMNQVKGDIENTINFLNEGAGSASKQRYTPSKKINLPNTRISQKSQGFEESSQNKEEEEDHGMNQEISDQNYGQPSLEERCQDKNYQNSMDEER